MQKNNKEKKKSVYPLLMTLVKANFWRIVISLFMFMMMSALDFFWLIVFEELLGRFKEKENKDDNTRFNLVKKFVFVSISIFYDYV